MKEIKRNEVGVNRRTKNNLFSTYKDGVPETELKKRINQEVYGYI